MANYAKMLENIQGFNFVSGVLHKECIYLIAKNYYDVDVHGRQYDEWDYPKELRIYMYMPKSSKKQDEWFGKAYNNADFLRKVTGVSDKWKKTTDFLGVFSDGDLAIQRDFKKASKGFELLYDIIPVRGAVTDLALIDNEVYASASGGEVYKLIRNDKWQEIASSVTGRFFSDERFTYGFLCIDGFSAEEIYAGGEKGILWLCDSGSWRPIELPANRDIKQIICASDGMVYLNMGDFILKGRKDTWKRVIVPKSLKWEYSIDKIAWFKEELYVLPMFASAQGMAIYRDEELKAMKVGSFKINPDKVINDNPLFGIEVKNMDAEVFIPGGINDMVANDELLMITGGDAVILFNGERWFNLFDKGRTEEELRATGTFYDPREL